MWLHPYLQSYISYQCSWLAMPLRRRQSAGCS
jgi:hypothetical protein